MDPNTGHLIEEIQPGPEGKLPAGYVPLPAHLECAALMKLTQAMGPRRPGVRREARVSLTSGGKLSQWARDQRRQQRNGKAKRRRRRKEARKAKRGR